MRRWLATLVVVLGWAPAPAWAHQSVARELVLQLDEQGAVAMWRLRAVGPRAILTTALWDRDRNGVLNDGERAGVAASLLSGANAGVNVSWDGRRIGVSDIDPRLESVGDRSMTAVALATLRLPNPVVGSHVVRIEVDEKSGPLSFQIQVLDFWQLTASDAELAPDRRGLAKPLVLAPGRALEIRVKAARNVERGLRTGEE